LPDEILRLPFGEWLSCILFDLGINRNQVLSLNCDSILAVFGAAFPKVQFAGILTEPTHLHHLFHFDMCVFLHNTAPPKK
jgi:hypothetical protein